jgi:hypothetical protein
LTPRCVDHVVDLPVRDRTAVAEALADFLLACLDAPRTVDIDAAAE